ncbi:MAG: hypothetical protein WA510_18670 [Acidobacteriaceae bacterium]
MSGKADFSVDEWDLLRTAPMMASLLVVAASPSGPVGLIQESAAAGKVVTDAAATAQTPLLKELAQDLSEKMTIPRAPEGATPEKVQGAAAEILRRTSALLAAKATPEEANEMKEWLSRIGQATAEAAKEGGFLGFGGTLVSEDEKTALSTLHTALGVGVA